MNQELLREARDAITALRVYEDTKELDNQFDDLCERIDAALAQPQDIRYVAVCAHPRPEICESQLCRVKRECQDPLHGKPPVAPFDPAKIFGKEPDAPIVRQDMVMVPREPTDRMCVNGSAQIPDFVNQVNDLEIAERVYKAMLSASQGGK